MAVRFDVTDPTVLPAPVVAAPMAGGPSTPELVAAVADAGGLGFLAAGYVPAAALSDQITRTRELTSRPFGVNVFVPGRAPHGAELESLRAHVAAYRGALAPDAARLGVTLPEPNWADDDGWEEKIALLTLVDPVPVVSFTFGVPGGNVVEDLQAVGTAVWVTVTDLAEARAAREVGADALVVQGFDAGGHRSTHDVADVPNELDHLALLPVLSEVGLPMIAAGGVTTAGDVSRARAAGAAAVQVGTAFLLTEEAGTSSAHRLGLTDPALRSTVTRAFSGRPARGLANRFALEHSEQAPAAYPVVDQLTKPLRAESAAAGDIGGVSLWAGSGWRAAAEGPAAAVVARLAAADSR
ncbi:MAG: nitronate monooxygenase [Austwickia sp.]|nr:MAG: nitronate monooxygenase [Austwickia sp.]